MSNTENIDEAMAKARDALLGRSIEEFDRFGGVVTPMGATAHGLADRYSDLDVWVSIPDERMDDFAKARHKAYCNLGNNALNFVWERPQYAPLGGVHSILLYDTSTPLLVEADLFVAPECLSSYYADLISGQKDTDQFIWSSGEDDPSVASQLNYSALVTLWAAKYYARGTDRLAWAKGRYHQVLGAIGLSNYPAALDLQAPACATDLITIANSLREIAEDTLPPEHRKVFSRTKEHVDYIINELV